MHTKKIYNGFSIGKPSCWTSARKINPIRRIIYFVKRRQIVIIPTIDHGVSEDEETRNLRYGINTLLDTQEPEKDDYRNQHHVHHQILQDSWSVSISTYMEEKLRKQHVTTKDCFGNLLLSLRTISGCKLKAMCNVWWCVCFVNYETKWS